MKFLQRRTLSARPARTPRRRGLALIEVLLCSSIAAMMLTATAVAFRASVGVYRDNTDRNILLGHGRTALRQIIHEMRQADVHFPMNSTSNPNAETLFGSGQVVEVSGIQLLKKHADPDDPNIVTGTSSTWVLLKWEYNAANQTITRSRTVNNVQGPAVVIAQYVKEFKVRMEPTRSAANLASGNTSFDLMLRGVVSILMQNADASGTTILKQGHGLVTERLIDAAVPRRNFAGL
jgi:hypothetical protein